jgi:tRNA threonylcarbamoyladenosine biosynthesis protein TsaE
MTRCHTFSSENAEQTEALGAALGRVLQTGQMVGLLGDLGAGKTCFVRGVGEGLNVAEETRVCSPTFTIVNEYGGRIPLIHVDFYRLGDADELFELGMDDYYWGGGAVLVEWADKFLETLPKDRLMLSFSCTGDETRDILVDATGPLHEELLGRWIGECK